MQQENEETRTRADRCSTLYEIFSSIIALIALCVIFVIDKILNMIEPPLLDTYYLGIFLLAVPYKRFYAIIEATVTILTRGRGK